MPTAAIIIPHFEDAARLARCLAALVSRESSADWLLGRVRDLALALPDAEERASHSAPGWRVLAAPGGRLAPSPRGPG